MNISRIVLAIVGLTFVGTKTSLQGICIPSPIKVSRVEGSVLWKPNGKPMSGVHVELLTFDNKMRQLAEMITETDGHFALKPAKSGKYYLRAEEDHLGSLTVELQYEQKTKLRDSEHINFLLNLVPNEYCWGSSVAVVRD